MYTSLRFWTFQNSLSVTGFGVILSRRRLTANRSRGCVRMGTRILLSTYLPTYIPPTIPTDLYTYPPPCTYLPTYLPTYPPLYPPTVPTDLYTYPPTYTHTSFIQHWFI